MHFKAPNEIYNKQCDLNSKMYMILTFWLIEVFYKINKKQTCQDYRRIVKALILLNKFIDETPDVKRSKLQLYGVTSFLITSLILDKKEAVYLCDKAYKMDKFKTAILELMEFDSEQHNLCDELSKKHNRDFSKKFVLLIVKGEYTSQEISELVLLSDQEFLDKFYIPIEDKNSYGYDLLLEAIKKDAETLPSLSLDKYISKTTYNEKYVINDDLKSYKYIGEGASAKVYHDLTMKL